MARRRAKSRSRRHKNRLIEQRYVIATEGRSTEMKYIDSLRERYGVRNVKYAPRKWNRTKPMQVLNDLLDYRASQSRDRQSLDEYWVVFDHDNCEDHELKQVQEKANRYRCKLADSKPCFELWLLLHFKPLGDFRRLETSGDNSPCSPAERYLETEDKSYDRNRKGKYDANKYLGKIHTAIRNARAVDRHSAELPLIHIGSRVYKLVESIISTST